MTILHLFLTITGVIYLYFTVKGWIEFFNTDGNFIWGVHHTSRNAWLVALFWATPQVCLIFYVIALLIKHIPWNYQIF